MILWKNIIVVWCFLQQKKLRNANKMKCFFGFVCLFWHSGENSQKYDLMITKNDFMNRDLMRFYD